MVEPSSSDYEIVTYPKYLVVIGASTGGPIALAQIIPKLPNTLQAAVVVIQQMRPGFTRLLADQMNATSRLNVSETADFQPLGAGHATIAPGNCCVAIDCPPQTTNRPCMTRIDNVEHSIERMRKRIDETMTSAAATFGKNTIGVLLTGIGDDGRQGLRAIKEAGGRTIVQDEVTSIVFEMPRFAIDAKVVDEVLPLWSIADRIIEIVEGSD